MVLCGRHFLGMSLEEAEPDFAFLNALPGQKWLLKGNHDYWWTTASKMNRFFAEHGFDKLTSSTTTAPSTEMPPCAAPGAGFLRRTLRPSPRRCSSGS